MRKYSPDNITYTESTYRFVFLREPEPPAAGYTILVCEGERLFSKSTEAKSIYYISTHTFKSKKCDKYTHYLDFICGDLWRGSLLRN